jgi:LPXTG-motif cell wall-anchored protein
VRAGGSGDAILNAVAQVGYRSSDHLIWQIDGQPTPAFADDTHYWSYWHDVAGSWRYSTVGASGYQPPAGTVEGWSFVDGQASPSPPPWNPSGLYASICGAQDPKPAPPTTTRTRPRPAPGPVTHRAGSTTAQQSSPTSHGVDGTSTARSTGPAHSPAESIPAPSGPASARSSADLPRPGPSGSATGSPHPRGTGSSGSPVPAVVGLGLVALVGGGGVWAAMRRRRTG